MVFREGVYMEYDKLCRATCNVGSCWSIHLISYMLTQYRQLGRTLGAPKVETKSAHKLSQTTDFHWFSLNLGDLPSGLLWCSVFVWTQWFQLCVVFSWGANFKPFFLYIILFCSSPIVNFAYYYPTGSKKVSLRCVFWRFLCLNCLCNVSVLNGKHLNTLPIILWRIQEDPCSSVRTGQQNLEQLAAIVLLFYQVTSFYLGLRLTDEC